MKKFFYLLLRVLLPKFHFAAGRKAFVIFIFTALFINHGISQNPRIYSTAGTTAYSVPGGVTCLKVQAWGGGGNGGNGTGMTKGGGGGGAYAADFVSVTPFASITLTVGAAAAFSSFGSAPNVKAFGGTSATSNVGANGGSKTVCIGLIKNSGGKGGNGFSTTSPADGGGGGGGGSATAAANGSVGSNGTSTLGGAGGAGQGAGGRGGDFAPGTMQSVGSSPGGGGGGRGGSGSSAAGSPGMVIVSYIDITNFSISTPASICSGTTTVTVASSTLPSDTYVVTYDLTGTNTATGSTATMVFSGGTGTFTTSTLSNGGATTVTITSIAFSGAGCATTISTGNTANLTVNEATVVAGSNITTCSGTGDINITAGSSGVYGTSLLWSTNGTGTFTNNTSADATTLTTYNPSAADILAGSRTLTLTATSGVCSATSSKTITIGSSVLQFSGVPSSVAQDAITYITVSSYCAGTSSVDLNYTGNITLAVNTGCGFVQQTLAASAGSATFPVVFTRSPQTSVQLKASATGFATVNSTTFDITSPASTPTSSVIAYQNFEDAGTWNWTVGTPVYSGSGGSGTDWTVVKTINGNKSLCKSFTHENGVSQKLSTTTITFDTKTADLSSVPLSDYSSLRLRFKIGSIYDANGTPRTTAYPFPYVYPSGGDNTASGVDPGENMSIEMRIDGTWYPLLSYLIGTDNYKFDFSSSNTNLAYNANAVYTQPSTNSSFTVFIPNGTTSVAFRMIAANNRPPENWAIDSIYLSGIKNVPNMPKLTPAAAGTALLTCPASVNTLSAYVSDTYGTVTYSWSPSTYITSGATTSSPTAVLPSGLSTPYTITGTFIDADGCSDTAQVKLSFPGGVKGNWYGYKNQDWFQCDNWGLGDVPDDQTNVRISIVPNLVEINPLSPYASLFGGTAYAQSMDVYDTVWLQQNAILKIRQDLTIRNTAGRIDMSSGGENTGTSTLYLKGNWLNGRGIIGFVAGKGKVVLDSTVAQSITTAATTETFNSLTVNKTGGNVTLISPIVVKDTLNLSGGIINTEINSPDVANSLGLLTMDTSAIVAGTPSTIAYVNGQMRKYTNVNHADEFTFPIGKVGSPYNPAGVLPVTHAAGTTRTSYTAEYFYNFNPALQFDHPFAGSAQLDALLKDRYWQIDRSGTGTAKVALNYTAAISNGDWVLPRSATSPPLIPTGTNVAVAHDLAGPNNDETDSYWHFTKTSGNFNVSGPLYEAIYYTYTGKVYSATMSTFSPFTIGFGSNTILPVKLLGFEGRLLGTDGSLSWKVADAGDLAGFDLEYSDDGIHYKKLASIIANGSLSYGYLHRSLPAGVHYYRLLVKEKTGNKFYSSVAMLSLGTSRTEILGLTSTIVKNKIGVKILSAKNQSVQAFITDVAGRKMGSQKAGVQAGINQWQMPTSLLANGMYFINIITDDGVKATWQFIKE